MYPDTDDPSGTRQNTDAGQGPPALPWTQLDPHDASAGGNAPVAVRAGVVCTLALALVMLLTGIDLLTRRSDTSDIGPAVTAVAAILRFAVAAVYLAGGLALLGRRRWGRVVVSVAAAVQVVGTIVFVNSIESGESIVAPVLYEMGGVVLLVLTIVLVNRRPVRVWLRRDDD